MRGNYLSILKLQRLHRWSLRTDRKFHPTLYWACDYLSRLGLKLNHFSKRGHWAYYSSQLGFKLIHVNKSGPMGIKLIKGPRYHRLKKCCCSNKVDCDHHLTQAHCKIFYFTTNVNSHQDRNYTKPGELCLISLILEFFCRCWSCRFQTKLLQPSKIRTSSIICKDRNTRVKMRK